MEKPDFSYDLHTLKMIAQVNAAIVRASATIKGMEASNQQQIVGGGSPCYLESDFESAWDNECLGTNSVITLLNS